MWFYLGGTAVKIWQHHIPLYGHRPSVDGLPRGGTGWHGDGNFDHKATRKLRISLVLKTHSC